MQHWGSSGSCWYRRKKRFDDLNRNFPHGFRATFIVIPMRRLPTSISYMGLNKNDSNTTHQKLHTSLSKGYFYYLLCAILLLSLPEFCDIFRWQHHASKFKMIHLHTNPDEDAQIFGVPADSYLGNFPITSLEKPFHLLVHHHAWNAVR